MRRLQPTECCGQGTGDVALAREGLGVRIGGKVESVEEVMWVLEGEAEGGKVELRFSGGVVQMTREAFCRAVKAYDADLIHDWLVVRQGRTFSVGDLRRLGLLQERGLSMRDGEGSVWEVKRLVWSSGKMEGFAAGRYYASHRACGGRKTFWLVDFYTLKSQSVFVEELGSPITSDVEERECEDPLRPLVALKFDINRQARYLDWLDDYARKKADVFIPIGGPGNRERGERTAPYRIQQSSVFCHAEHGECVRAAVCNALEALVGQEVAREFLDLGSIAARSLADAQRWLEKNMGRFHLMKHAQPLPCDIAVWLDSLDEGMYLVRLVGRDSEEETVDHVVLVDTKNKIIVDSAEHHALRMEEAALLACVGDKFEFERIMEVRLLKAQRKGKGKKNRRIPVEIRRARKKRRLEEQESKKKQRRIVEESEEE